MDLRRLHGEEPHRAASHHRDGVVGPNAGDRGAVEGRREDVAQEEHLFVLHALGDLQEVDVRDRDTDRLGLRAAEAPAERSSAEHPVARTERRLPAFAVPHWVCLG